MKIELTQREVEQAITLWLKEKYNIKGPMEIYETHEILKAYTVQTDPNCFVYKEEGYEIR